MSPPSPWRLFTIAPEDASGRIDSWLASRIEGLSRRQAQQMIADGEVTIDTRRVKKSFELRPGIEVAVWRAPAGERWAPMADPSVPLEVLLEDEYLVAVEKPSGIASVPLKPDEGGTLAGAVVARFPECAQVGRSAGDGGLIHRLDRETSGAVLVARSQEVHDILTEMQARGAIEKRYLALVGCGDGSLPQVIDAPLEPTGPGGRKMASSKIGRPATTKLRMLEEAGDWLLVEAVIHRGQRHQIRAHLAGAGFPIAGDTLYGSIPPPEGLTRLFLHAHTIHFNHPQKSKPITITSPLPKDLPLAVTVSQTGE